MHSSLSSAYTTPPQTPSPKDELQHSKTSSSGCRRVAALELEVNVGLHSASHFFGGLSDEQSATGIFVATYQPLPLGELVRLLITLPDQEEICLHGVVRWTREDCNETHMPPGVGIAFPEVVEDEGVRAFLQLRPTLYYDV